MTDSDWLRTVFGAITIVLASWLAWVSLVAHHSLSRDEHRDICEDRESRLTTDLEEIKALIRQNHQESKDARDLMHDRITDLSLKIARITPEGSSPFPRYR